MGEAALSQTEVYSARPVVRVDEQERLKISELINSFVMKEQEGGMSSLEMRLSNIASDPQGSADFAFENEEDIPPLLTTKLGIRFEQEDLKSFIQDLYLLIQKKVKSIRK